MKLFKPEDFMSNIDDEINRGYVAQREYGAFLADRANAILNEHLKTLTEVKCSRELHMPDKFDSSKDYYVWFCEEHQPFNQKKFPQRARLIDIEEIKRDE